jgi:midasin (ATPase involved in ribosome maturation)
MLWEYLLVEQESSTNLVEQVDKLKRKTKKTEREFEEFKIQQQEEYNRLYEDIMRFSSSSVTLNRQLCWFDAVNICRLMCGLVCRFDVMKLYRWLAVDVRTIIFCI